MDRDTGTIDDLPHFSNPMGPLGEGHSAHRVGPKGLERGNYWQALDGSVATLQSPYTKNKGNPGFLTRGLALLGFGDLYRWAERPSGTGLSSPCESVWTFGSGHVTNVR